MSLHFQLLGELGLSYKGEALDLSIDRKSLALLCYLAVTHESARRDELAELLWGAGKLNNLRQALYKIRQLPGADDWLTDEDPLTLNATTDVAAFESLIEQENVEDALKLWQGGLLEQFKPIKAPAFMDWLELERSRLLSLQQEASDTFLEQLEAHQDFDKALPLAKDLLERDPLNESAHRIIMQLEHGRGNTEAALEQFELLRERLKQELDVEPLTETLELLAQIEQGGAGTGKNALLISAKEGIPNLPDKLIGREDLLKEASSTLNKHKRILIHGFGGIGKTALAAQLSQTYLKNGNLLWLELGQSDPASTLDALAKAFDAQQQLAQSQNKSQFIQSLISEQNISLIVLDDVWNAYTLSVILETLPQNSPIIITSRQRYPKLKRVNVGRLERKEAVELLSHTSERNLNKDALDGADALCAHLGDHAYAIRVAGINLKQNQLKPKELLENIKNAPHDLRIPEALTSEDQGSIANLLKVSLEPLDDRAYEAFLAYGGLFSASATPELLSNLLKRNIDVLEEALFNLSQHGLATRTTQAGSDLVSYHIHDLAHSYTKAINNHRTKSIIEAVKDYLETHKNNPENLEAELQNILGAGERANANTLVEIMRLLILEGSYYLSEGHSPSSIALLEKAAKAAQDLNNPELTHELLAKIGNHYLNYLGKNNQAYPYFEQALALATQTKQLSRQAVYQSLLGIILLRRNDKSTKTVFEASYKLAQNSQTLDSCIVFANNGYFYAMQGDFKKAQDLFTQSLAISSSLSATSKQEEAEIARQSFFALNNLAQCLHELNAYADAISKRNDALNIAKQHENPLWMADAFYGLGETHHALKTRDLAQSMFKEALKLYEDHRAKAYADELRVFMQEQGY